MQPTPCRYCGRDTNYNPFHDTESCMRNRIAELEAENQRLRIQADCQYVHVDFCTKCGWQALEKET